MTQNGRLSVKQEALLLGLMAGEGIEAAARSAKVSPRTAYRWQRLPVFEAKLEQAKEEAFEKKLAILKEGVGAAISTLARNMGGQAPAGVQVSAARCWLETAIQLYKSDALESALEEVQQLLREGGFNRVSAY